MCQFCLAPPNTPVSELRKMAVGVHRRFRRRPQPKITRNPVNSLAVHGTAHLCFPEDHSYFQGSIAANDQTKYSLYGKRVSDFDDSETKFQDGYQKPNSINNGQELTLEAMQSYYRVTLVDHFSGLTHTLPKVYARRQLDQKSRVLFASKSGEVSFEVTNMFKGQQADMEIKNIFGTTAKETGDRVIYTGDIKINFDEEHYQKFHKDNKAC